MSVRGNFLQERVAESSYQANIRGMRLRLVELQVENQSRNIRQKLESFR